MCSDISRPIPARAFRRVAMTAAACASTPSSVWSIASIPTGASITRPDRKEAVRDERQGGAGAVGEGEEGHLTKIDLDSRDLIRLERGPVALVDRLRDLLIATRSAPAAPPAAALDGGTDSRATRGRRIGLTGGRSLGGACRQRRGRCRARNLAGAERDGDERSPVHHWMSSSARSSSVSGIVSPNVFAVFRLMTNSNLVGCSTGRSAGLAPLRTLST